MVNPLSCVPILQHMTNFMCNHPRWALCISLGLESVKN